MKATHAQPTWRSVLVVLAAGFALGTPAWTGTGLAAEQPQLADLMKSIGRAHRKLRRQAKESSQRDESLALVRSMQRSAATALSLQPAMTDGLPRDKQDAFVLAYKRKKIQLLGALLDLEEALLAGKFERAAQITKNLGTIKKEAHEKFQEQEDS
jgi:hypothetical protein